LFSCAVPGPPASLELLSATETSVQAAWTPPFALNDVFTDYIVAADPINTYSATNQVEPRQWIFPNSTLKAGLPDLHPGTLYNISVATHSDRATGVKISDTVWTQIGGKNVEELCRKSVKFYVQNCISACLLACSYNAITHFM
jgi:hypothetical protein